MSQYSFIKFNGGSGPENHRSSTTPSPENNSMENYVARTLTKSQEDLEILEAGDKPKKKRKTTSRACDACAIRKVKCEQRRPCSHCVTNNLNCTQLRQRKKSGPKTLHKKTLDSINSFSEPTQNETLVRPLLSERSSSSTRTLPTVEEFLESKHPDHPAESVPVDLADNDIQAPVVNLATDVLTASHLIELLRLTRDPMVSKCMQNLTVHSIISNNEKHILFLRKHFPNSDGDLVIVHSNDLIYLSKLLIILTLNLLIVEVLIKCQSIHYNIEFMNGDIVYFRKLKNLLQSKITEVLLPIDQLSIFPINSTVQKSHTSQLLYYNQSIASLHLCNFHQTTNYLNPQNQDQQKLIHLRKSITYYQLINIPFKNTPELTDIQLYELYESLFTMESLYFFLSSDFIIKSNNVLLNEWNSFNFSHIQFQRKSTNGNSLFEIFKIINKEDLINSKSINYLFKFSIFNSNKNNSIHNIKKINDNKTIGNTSYIQFKQFLNNLSNKDLTFEILKYIILFKIIIIHCNELNFMHLKCELIESVINANNLLNLKDDNLNLQIGNYQLLPHLMQILKFNIEIERSHLEENRNLLVAFTKNLIELFPFCNSNITKIIRSSESLNSWFDQVSKTLGQEMEAEPDYLLDDILNDMGSKLIHSNDATNTNSKLVTQYSSPLNVLNDFGAFDPESASNGTGRSTLNNNSTTPVTITVNPDSDDIRTIPNSLFLHPLPASPAPPVVTTRPATVEKTEDLSELISLSLSESAKNLYNTFHQFTDDYSTTNSTSNNNLSNLFQFNANNRATDWTINSEDIKNQPSFLL